MENVVLVIHLILAMCLIGVVLLQRSEGGGLGMGGGGGVMSGRQAATALSKLTWIFATGFLITSLGLTVLAAKNAAGSSVVDAIGAAPAVAPVAPAPVTGDDLLNPPAAASDVPATQVPASEDPATPPKAD